VFGLYFIKKWIFKILRIQHLQKGDIWAWKRNQTISGGQKRKITDFSEDNIKNYSSKMCNLVKNRQKLFLETIMVINYGTF